MSNHLDLFDTSNYPREHFLFSEKNKKVVDKLKDETAGCAVKAFVGLRPKMYSFIVNDGKESEIKKAKGVSKSVVNREISYEQYLDCLFGGDFERQNVFYSE
ncbi:uncharacterized protein LOC144624385 [Crassostrea virginica]